MASPDSITKSTFQSLLSKYPALIESSAPGQKPLKDLDSYRYDQAPTLFHTQNQQMTLSDVQALVEWKLRHGKFRPTLMSLVSSNPPAFTEETISSAIKLYRMNPAQNAQKALDTLTKLRGVGPATASLLLNVHDPERVVFFSDELFYWLCCGGKKGVIKYNAKEYWELRRMAEEVATRLAVGMVDVEKVAYVVMRDGKLEEGKNNGKKSQGKKFEGAKRIKGEDVKRVKNEGSVVKSVVKSEEERPQTKRKTDEVDDTGLRRSKRHRV